MANEPVITGTKPNPLDGGAGGDATTNNDEVARKLAAQDISANLTDSSGIKPAEDALDELAKKAEEEAKKKADAAAAGAPKVEPKPAGAPDPQVTPATETPEQKVAREKAEADAKETEAIKKRADEIFKDSPALAPNAAPKSHEAFAAVKVQAARDIGKLQAEKEALAKENAELKKNTGKPTAEFEAQAKELKEAREKLAKFDVEADPQFKEFDGRIGRAQDFIYDQLKRMPNVDDKLIEEIKKLGGPQRLNIEKFFEGINDPTTKRLVESKVADILSIEYDKKQAIKAAQGNVEQYLKEREGAAAKASEQRVTQTTAELDKVLPNFEWFKAKPADVGTDEEKKAATEYNTFLETTKAEMASAIADDSPQMKAVLVAAYGQFVNIRRLYEAQKGEVDRLTKDNAALNDKFEKLKRAGASKLKESAAPTDGKTNIQPKQDQFNTKAADALDAHAKAIMEQRAAVGGNA